MAGTRGSAACILLLLAACEVREVDDTLASGADPVPCALDGASQFNRGCAAERFVEGEVLFLVIHHPDGGFRRLQVMQDGSGVSTPDGADPARITPIDNQIEVAVGNDRYLLPVTMTDNGSQ